MTEPPKPQDDKPAPDAIARWIRQRREELGLSLGDLAKAAGVSSAFMSMVESGKKRPGTEVVARLANKLGENEGLLLKWTEAYRPKSLEAARRTAREVEEFLAREESRRRSGGLAPERPGVGALRQDEGVRPASSSIDAALSPTRASTLISVPVVAEGSDPEDASADAGMAEDTFTLDTALLPPGERLVRPYAYRLSDAGARRAKDVLRAGDLAIISRECWPLVEDEIYAVQLEEGIVLSRVLVKGDALLLLSSDPGSEGFELLPIASPARAPDQLRGRVAVAIRRWR